MCQFLYAHLSPWSLRDCFLLVGFVRQTSGQSRAGVARGVYSSSVVAGGVCSSSVVAVAGGVVVVEEEVEGVAVGVGAIE